MEYNQEVKRLCVDDIVKEILKLKKDEYIDIGVAWYENDEPQQWICAKKCDIIDTEVLVIGGYGYDVICINYDSYDSKQEEIKQAIDNFVKEQFGQPFPYIEINKIKEC